MFCEYLYCIRVYFSFTPTNEPLTLKQPNYCGLRKVFPAYLAPAPNSSSMRKIWLYFAKRSERHGAPVLIWPVLKPTTKSAMNVSSVSPERCDTIVPQPLLLANKWARMDSVTVPIWLTFNNKQLHAFFSTAVAIRFGFVTVKSSPTIWTLVLAVMLLHAFQSENVQQQQHIFYFRFVLTAKFFSWLVAKNYSPSWSNGSSTLTIGNSAMNSWYKLVNLSGVNHCVLSLFGFLKSKS